MFHCNWQLKPKGAWSLNYLNWKDRPQNITLCPVLEKPQCRVWTYRTFGKLRFQQFTWEDMAFSRGLINKKETSHSRHDAKSNVAGEGGSMSCLGPYLVKQTTVLAPKVL